MMRGKRTRGYKTKKGTRGEKGASIVFALFGLMIAAMVSMVVVSAAWMNANRLGNMDESEQARLTVNSVAKVVRDSLADNYTGHESDDPAPPAEVDQFMLKYRVIEETISETDESGETVTTPIVYSVTGTDNKVKIVSDSDGKRIVPNSIDAVTPESFLSQLTEPNGIQNIVYEMAIEMDRQRTNEGTDSISRRYDISVPVSDRNLFAMIGITMASNYDITIRIDNCSSSGTIATGEGAFFLTMTCGSSFTSTTDSENGNSFNMQESGEWTGGWLDNSHIVKTYKLSWPEAQISVN